MSGPLTADRVWETSTTAGTGALTLAGAKVGYQAFSAVGDGNTCFYCIADPAGPNWEVGIGTYTAAGTTLSRDTVLASSNSGSLVDFGAGVKDVFGDWPGGIMPYLLSTGAFASLAAAQAGRLGFPSDGYCLYRDNGSALVPWGPIFPFTQPPAIASFSWVNQGSSTAVSANGGIYLHMPSTAGLNLSALVVSTPAPPYAFTAYLRPALGYSSAGFPSAGLCWRDSVSEKLIHFGVYLNQGSNGAISFSVSKDNSPTSFSNDYVSTAWPAILAGGRAWLRIQDDGTNRICSYSVDGQNFLQLHSVGNTDFLTANEVGFFAGNNSSANEAGCLLLSWAQS